MTQEAETKTKGGIRSLGDALDGEQCSNCGREFIEVDVVAAGIHAGRMLHGKPVPMPYLSISCPECDHCLCLEMLGCGTIPLCVMVLDVHQRLASIATVGKG